MKEQLNELALFAGAGGGILGGKLLGWRTVCAVEWDAYARDVLVARQNDGCLEAFPIWDDVQTFDGKPWRGRVDVVSGGFPCQDISIIGKGAGIEGGQSGMWKHMARIIGEVLPRFIFVENSPMLVGRGLATVLSDLAGIGYDARWTMLGARHVGACHRRERLWLLGYPSGKGLQGHSGYEQGEGGGKKQGGSNSKASVCVPGWKRVIYASDCERDMDGCDGELKCPECGDEYAECACPGPTMDDEYDYQIRGGVQYAKPKGWWTTERGLERVANGIPNRVDRLRCIGNGQVPSVAQLAWQILSNNHHENNI